MLTCLSHSRGNGVTDIILGSDFALVLEAGDGVEVAAPVDLAVAVAPALKASLKYMMFNVNWCFHGRVTSS